MSTPPPPWVERRDGRLVLAVRVQPGARRTEVVGVVGGDLKIRVAAPPVEGKANAALVSFLAERLGVPRSRVTITRGGHGRSKRVEVDADVDPTERLLPGAG